MSKAAASVAVQKRKGSPSAVVYWFRFGLGIGAALLCYGLQLKGPFSPGVAALLFAVSCIVVKHVFRYGAQELKGPHKYITLGAGTYIFEWAAFFILLYTLRPY